MTPWRVRLRFWWRRVRYRLAVRLVWAEDGVVVSQVAYRAALDRLAALSEWADAAGLSRRVADGHEAAVEDVTRLLVIAAEAGDPALQLTGLQERYVNLRLRAMSKRKRQRLHHEAGLRALEARLGHQEKKGAAPV